MKTHSSKANTRNGIWKKILTKPFKIDTWKKTKLAATVVALSSICFTGYEKPKAATAVLPLIANLVHAIEISVLTSMNFGTLALTLERVGKASLDPSLNKLFTDGNSSLSPAGGNPRAGRLLIRGAALPVSVSIEENSVTLTNGTAKITVTNFNFMSANGGSAVTIVPDNVNFAATIPVGGTLNTKVGQIAGTYRGTTRVFANYQ